GARVRLAAVLAVLLVIGLSGAALGNNGDPVILGQVNTAHHHAETLVFGGGFGSNFLQSTGNVLAGGWVSAGRGLTLESHQRVIGRLAVPAGQRCAIGPTPARDPGDDQSTSMVFTSVVGFPHGVYVAGSVVIA